VHPLLRVVFVAPGLYCRVFESSREFWQTVPYNLLTITGEEHPPRSAGG
jgi:hypothetical protein